MKAGTKIGVRTNNALVKATLPPMAWKKLAQAANEWTQWAAALSSGFGAHTS